MIKEIKFTDKAIKQINNLLSQKDPGSFFRIAIKGGGCSGFQYEFTFDKKLEADDLKHENILIMCVIFLLKWYHRKIRKHFTQANNRCFTVPPFNLNFE